MCKSCRFKKCLEVGMNVSTSFKGRISLKRRKELIERQLENMNNYKVSSDISTDEDNDPINKSKSQMNDTKPSVQSLVSNDKNVSYSDYDHIIMLIVIDQIAQAYEKANNNNFLFIDEIINQDNDIYIANKSDDVWTLILESFRLTIKNFISYIKILPGLNEICHDDLEIVVKEKLFEFFIIINLKQFINDECFIMLPNGQRFKNSLIEKYLGFEFKRTLFEIVDKINNLNLSCKELSIFLSIILTNFGNLKNIDCILIEFLFIYFNN